MRCPNETTLQLLYNHSWNFEKAVIVTENKTQQKVDFNIGWDKALESNKFCNYDPGEIAKIQEWQMFFEHSF